MDKRRGEFNVEKFFKDVKKSPPKYSHIDELNDETFGDGAIEYDWEAHHSDKSVSSNDRDKTPSREEVILEKSQGFTFKQEVKDLWDDDDHSSSTTDQIANIWSSPTIPSPSIRVHHDLPTKVKDLPTKAKTVEELERDFYETSPPPPLLSSSPSSSSPSSSSSGFPSHILHTLQQHSPSHQAHSPPTANYMRPPVLQYYPMGRPHPSQFLPRGPHPPSYMMRGPLPPNVPMMGPPRIIPRVGLMPHPSMRHPIQMGFRHQYIRPHPHPPPPPINARSPPPRFPSKLNEMLCDLKPDGSGFMNQKEKEWIIKVQLLQLHTSSPQIDDYYYQHYMQKKYTNRHKEEGVVVSSSDVSLSLPPPINNSNSQDEKKRQKLDFENTLGKISVSSVSAPRKTIDVSASSTTTTSSTNSEMVKKDNVSSVKKRRILLTIEEMYNLLLKLDDLNETDPSYDKDSREICAQIFDLTCLKTDLSSNDDKALIKEGELFFQQILHFRKGKFVLQRILPILSEHQAKTILFSISKSLGALIRKDSNDKVLPEIIPAVRGVILMLNLSEVSHHVTYITAAVTSKVVDNVRISSYLSLADYLTSFITQGSYLLEKNTDIDQENSQSYIQWVSSLQQLRETLSTIDNKCSSFLEITNKIKSMTLS